MLGGLKLWEREKPVGAQPREPQRKETPVKGTNARGYPHYRLEVKKLQVIANTQVC